MRIQAEVGGGTVIVRIWTGSGQAFPQSTDRERLSWPGRPLDVPHLPAAPAPDKSIPSPQSGGTPMPLAAIKVGDSVQQALDSFFGFVPNILGFLVILLIGFIIAKIAKKAIVTLLQKVGLDRALHSSDAGQYVERVSPGASPAKLIGAVAFWFVFLFAISAAIGALKIPALSDFIAQVQAFLPNIIVAALIFVIAGALAGVVGGAAHKLMGDTPTGKIVRAVVPGLILAIGTFMVLDQLNIAPQIVTITYAALLGMLALAGALAFGLGGREVAADLLRSAYESGQQSKEQVERDVRTGKQRAQQHADSRDRNGQTTAGSRGPGSARA